MLDCNIRGLDKIMRERWVSLVTTWSIVIVVTVVALNIGSYFALRYVYDIEVFSETGPAELKDKFFKKPWHSVAKGESFPHPYLGLIGFRDQVYTNELSNEPLFSHVHKSPSTHDIKVLILGGSVAQSLAAMDDIFAIKLNEYFNTDRFSVYSAAYPGYKEPQQYLKFVYLDLLGFHPDIVLNYDGFNDIVLPVTENRLLQIPAIFPRSHSMDLMSILDRSCVDTSNWLLDLQSRIPLVALVTYTVAKRCDARVDPWKVWPSSYKKPWWIDLFDTRGTEEDYAQRSAAIWRESSNRIYQFTKMHNIDYIHVIQPNQHVPNSKIWSEEEKRVNFLPGGFNAMGNASKQYYKLLSGDGLMAEHFLDQRYLFKDNSETLYIDFCCHLNHRGNELVTDDILAHFHDVFRKHLDSQSATVQ